MPIIVGGLLAIVAIMAGIVGHVDPVTTVVRSGLAFVLGWFAAKMWHGILSTQVRVSRNIGIEETSTPVEASE